MLGLEAYASSDDEAIDEMEPSYVTSKRNAPIATTHTSSATHAPAPDLTDQRHESPAAYNNPSLSSANVGPSFGPAQAEPEGIGEIGVQAESPTVAAPLSPYTAVQSARRNLTMPPVPKFDIPDSPPGSPPSESTKKFEQFLELKKKGVHFNARLADSDALRNPSLFQKLMDHAGLDEGDQYASALPDDLAVSTTFPPWAYGEQLNKKQEEMSRKREQEKRAARRPPEFVSSSKSAASSEGNTPGSSASKSDLRSRGIRGNVRSDGKKSRVKPVISNDHRDHSRGEWGFTEDRGDYRSRPS